MSEIFGKLRSWLLLAPLLATTTGCPRPTLTTAELIQKLSYAVLEPDVTCAQLRDDLGLVGLPLANTPADVGMPYEEHWVTASAGALLRVWYLPVENHNGLVIISPGNTGSMPCYLFTAQLLHEGSYTVVMYDYEGFGGSSGELSLLALRPDLEAVTDWARAYSGFPAVTLFGMSLGSIPSIAVAVDRPTEVNGVVLDSPIGLATQIERFSFLIDGRSDELIAILEPWLLSEATITTMQQPLLVYLHEQDVVTPPEAVQFLYDRAAGPKELVRFPELGHARGQFMRTEEYRAHLLAFLQQVWVP
jgi:pimeloyl-ACP methyl ester carboxylesterase